MKFANHVKVVCRDDNFENCLIVFDLIRAINSSLQEIQPQTKPKQIHVVLDAKNTFPSYIKFYSVELDESRQKTIQMLSYPPIINYKNFDYSILGPHTWNAQKISFTNIRFSPTPATQKFPNCTHMRLYRPRSIEALDFSSFKSL